ncbi:MAG: DNA-binding protein [Deltaproteobacteria bacterium]|nr:DNA-binding protein [Deltaproteobacteria bacterium]
MGHDERESRYPSPVPPANGEVAALLDRIASLLEVQHADGFRVRAWRRAAEQARRTPEPLADLVRDGGADALLPIPGFGRSIARQVAGWLRTGQCGYLVRLEGETEPEDLLRTLPGVGPELASRIHEALHVETLEELEVCAHDGRLAEVEGLGERRCEAIRDALAVRLARRRPPPPSPATEPPVGLLLEADAAYRERAASGTLRRIAPRRFNPEGEAWLPIWHVDLEGWHLTVLFSNTALAHQLGRTRDWVVVYAGRDGEERRYTIVTERRGPDAGARVVRGREAETRIFLSAKALVEGEHEPGSADAPDPPG